MPTSEQEKGRKSGRPISERSPLVGTVKRNRKPETEGAPAPARTAQVKQYSSLSLLSQVEVSALLNIGVSTLRRVMQDPGFPKRRRLPSGLRGWIYREIEEYICNLPVEGNDDSDD